MLGISERLRKLKLIKIQTHEYQMVYGSRKVIKGVHGTGNHYYGTDIWMLKGQELDGLVPKNYVVFGELIGWLHSEYEAVDGANDVAGYGDRVLTAKPIQKHYTYNEFPGRSELYVYRIAVINEDGVSVDLSWDNVVKFCDSVGLKHVIEVWRGPVGLFDPARWINIDFNTINWYDDNGQMNPIPLSADSPCDEGVCLRFEGLTPTIYKLKSPDFLTHETKMIDEEAPDVEAEESTPDVY